jgi:hypothetical protein
LVKYFAILIVDTYAYQGPEYSGVAHRFIGSGYQHHLEIEPKINALVKTVQQFFPDYQHARHNVLFNYKILGGYPFTAGYEDLGEYTIYDYLFSQEFMRQKYTVTLISMFKTTIILALTFSYSVLQGQSIKEFYRHCNTIPLNSRFDAKNSSLQYEYDKYGYARSYRLPCDPVKMLYNLPILKVLLHVDADTVNAIKIFLPFDSTLPKRMEADLGPSEAAWMAFEPGELDTASIIWDRRWFLDDYIIWFHCTRYITLRGHAKDDWIILALLPRKRKSIDPNIHEKAPLSTLSSISLRGKPDILNIMCFEI